MTERRVDLGIAILLVAVTVALYWPVHGFDFINFDDVDYVRGNTPVRAGLTLASLEWAFTTLRGSFWIPLTWLSYMVDSQVYGTGAGGYHATNVLLHATSTVLLFEVLRRATGRRWPSALVACLFAVHPVHVESVAWVTERKDTLSTVFLMLTLWSYGAYAARPTVGRYLITVLVFACGLMSKPMLITVPFLLLLVDLWPLGRLRDVPPGRLLLEKLLFLMLAVPSALVAMASGHHLDVDAHAPLAGIAIGERLANASESYVLYLWKTVWPTGLGVLYPDPGPPPPWRAALAALALVAMTLFAIRMADRRPWLTAGWLWYVVALLPVSGIVRIGHFVMADRFTYVPLVGIFVAVAWGLDELTNARRLVASGVALAVAALIVVARIQIDYWRNSLTLFEHTIAVTRANPVTQYMLGLALAERGRTDEAIARYTESLRLRPGYAHAHTSLGLLLFEKGRIDDAITQYTIALREDPDEVYAHANLANALLLQGHSTEAIAHYTEALRIDPDVAEVHGGYGRTLAAQHRLPEAIAEYGVALRLKPDDAEAHNNLANALADSGARDQALAHYTAALRIRPTYAAAHANLALFLAEQGRFPDAAEHYRTALRLEPGNARVHADLGNVLAADGKLEEAAKEYDEAIRLQPGNAAAHNNLGNVLIMAGRTDDGIAQYRDAVRLDPDYAEAHYNLGMVLADRGQTDEAITHFTDALRLKPDYAAAAHQLELVRAAKR